MRKSTIMDRKCLWQFLFQLLIRNNDEEIIHTTDFNLKDMSMEIIRLSIFGQFLFFQITICSVHM